MKGPESKAKNPALEMQSMTRGEHAMKSICLDPLMLVGGGVSEWNMEWALNKLC